MESRKSDLIALARSILPKRHYPEVRKQLKSKLTEDPSVKIEKKRAIRLFREAITSEEESNPRVLFVEALVAELGFKEIASEIRNCSKIDQDLRRGDLYIHAPKNCLLRTIQTVAAEYKGKSVSQFKVSDDENFEHSVHVSNRIRKRRVTNEFYLGGPYFGSFVRAKKVEAGDLLLFSRDGEKIRIRLEKDTKRKKACLRCKLVKTYGQFMKSGCENCPFFKMDQDKAALAECTTSDFTETIDVEEPSSSCVAQVTETGSFVPGHYAHAVSEVLPEKYVLLCKDNDVPYVPPKHN